MSNLNCSLYTFYLLPNLDLSLSYFKLISHIEGEGLDTEGLLRIPGGASRVKVGFSISLPLLETHVKW